MQEAELYADCKSSVHRCHEKLKPVITDYGAKILDSFFIILTVIFLTAKVKKMNV